MKSSLKCKVFAWLDFGFLFLLCVLDFLDSKINAAYRGQEFQCTHKDLCAPSCSPRCACVKLCFSALCCVCWAVPIPAVCLLLDLCLPNCQTGFSTALSWFLYCLWCGQGARQGCSQMIQNVKCLPGLFQCFTLSFLQSPFLQASCHLGEWLLFTGPLNFWKFAGGEDSATSLINFFFIGNYLFVLILHLGCIVFIFLFSIRL